MDHELLWLPYFSGQCSIIHINGGEQWLKITSFGTIYYLHGFEKTP